MPNRDLQRGDRRHKETRGRKPAPVGPVDPLPVRPAGLVTAADRSAYARIRKLAARSSRITGDDVEIVVQVAILLSDYERLRKEVKKLPSLIALGGNGNDRVHPLYDQMLKTGSAYRTALGQLLLTPRSRSASRLAKSTGQPGHPAQPGTPIPATTPADLRLFGA